MNTDVAKIRETLLERFETLTDKQEILKAPEIKQLLAGIKDVPTEQRASYGQSVNELKKELEQRIQQSNIQHPKSTLGTIDVTAPMDLNAPVPSLLPSEHGTIHPLTREMDTIADIFYRMGFTCEDSREIDDQYHMFESLNFPKGHPARDDYDTFMTVERDADGEPLIAPAHTSTMQNRTLKKYTANLDSGEPIASVVIDRCFRNEDLDARHEHTFYQIEGIYVDRGVTAGMLIATLQKFIEEYYGKKIEVRVNPFYFPFTEPSFEFALSCPFCDKAGCRVCSQSGWLELLGCGMIHPNVLKMAGIDPSVYTGFAFGCGIDRLVMMKYNIEDIRHFESAKLDFLRQF